MRYARNAIAATLIALALPPTVARAGDDVPAPRHKPVMVLDARRDRFLIFGGLGYGGGFRDVWQHPAADTGRWTWVECAGEAPPPRYGHAAVYDPRHDRIVVFGGDVPGSGPVNDVWELRLSPRPTWRRLVPFGAPPTPRFAHTAVYDPMGRRMVVFGGYDGTFRQDLWALSLDGPPTWSEMAAEGRAPAPRDAQVAIFDPPRRRMIVHGGFDGLRPLGDTWALRFDREPTWEPIETATSPPARRQHAAALDPVRGRMLIFGGTVDGQDAGFNDVWALPLAGGDWTRIEAAGPPPPPRWGPVIGCSPRHRGLLVFGGASLRGRFDDTAWLDLGSEPHWILFAAPPTPDIQPRIVPDDFGSPIRNWYR